VKEEKFEIEIETDDKTGLIKRIHLPSDLPLDQRITLLIPFIDSLRGAILRLDTSTRKQSKIVTFLTTVLIILTIALVGLGIAHLV